MIRLYIKDHHQLYLQANNKGNIKAPHYDVLCEGKSPVT